MRHESLDFGLRAIELDEQKAAAIGIIGMDGSLGSMNGEVVHHFDGGREHACGNDTADGGASFVSGRKGGEKRSDAFGTLGDAEDDFCGDAKSAFRADKDACQIVSGRVESFSAEVNEGAVRENDFKAEDMSGGETVFQAMRAPRIFRDVSADSANGLRRRIGGIKIFLRLDDAGDVEIEDAGFDDDAGVRDVDFKDAIHAHEAEDDAVRDGERAAAQARAGATRDEGNFFAVADADDGLDLLSGRRKQHSAGHDAKIGEAVAFVGVELFGGRNEAAAAHNGAELIEDGLVQHGAFGKHITPEVGEERSVGLKSYGAGAQRRPQKATPTEAEEVSG